MGGANTPRRPKKTSMVAPDATCLNTLRMIQKEWLRKPNVTGVDWGWKYVDKVRRPELAVRIHVLAKRSRTRLKSGELAPKLVNGVKTDVIEARYVAAAEPCSSALIRPGLSIGDAKGTTGGTIGLLTRNGAHMVGLLTAWHVAVGYDNLSWTGEPLTIETVQPARSHRRVGVVLVTDFDHDAAFVLLDNDVGRNSAILDTGIRLVGAKDPELNLRLDKVGASTSFTEGMVEGIHCQMRYSIGDQQKFLPVGFRLVRAPGATGSQSPLSGEGDSGSVWYDPQDSSAVGLHVAGDSSLCGEIAVASPLSVVLHAMNLTIVTQ